MYPCQHAIQFGTSQWVVGQVTEGLATQWACITDFSDLTIYMQGLGMGNEHPLKLQYE